MIENGQTWWLMLVIPELEAGKTSLVNVVKPHLYWKYKIAGVCWQEPVIPATGEAEAGESLETGEVEVTVSRDRATALQPGQKEQNCVSKKQTN